MHYHFGSKKFSFSVFSVIVIAAVGIAGHWLPEIVALYPTLVGGITAVAGLFLAGDVAAAHVASKVTLGAPVAPVPPEDPPAPV